MEVARSHASMTIAPYAIHIEPHSRFGVSVSLKTIHDEQHEPRTIDD